MIAPATPGHGKIRRMIWIVLIGYWLAAFTTTHVPVPSSVELPENSDKVVHVTMYAGLAYLLALLKFVNGPVRRRQYVIIFLIVMAYAVADELLQIPVDRVADFADGAADAVGAALGLTIFHFSQGFLGRLLERFVQHAQRISPSDVGRRQ